MGDGEPALDCKPSAETEAGSQDPRAASRLPLARGLGHPEGVQLARRRFPRATSDGLSQAMGPEALRLYGRPCRRNGAATPRGRGAAGPYFVATVTLEAGPVKDKQVRRVVQHPHLIEFGSWK